MTDLLRNSPDYASWLTDLKLRVEQARQRAALSVNRELISLYWQIGRDILERQRRQGWGAKVIDQLARDLKAAFPDMRGFSPRNLKYMRAFAEAWPDGTFVQQAAAQLPWFHLCTLLDKLKGNAEREWYATKAVEHGWSRNVLAMQIETRLHERQGGAVTNFRDRLFVELLGVHGDVISSFPRPVESAVYSGSSKPSTGKIDRRPTTSFQVRSRKDTQKDCFGSQVIHWRLHQRSASLKNCMAL
jgi:predicted nuclease of restriction endonuclease-like (RecB) superfamily